MTLVSIKNISNRLRDALSFKVSVETHIGHSRKELSQLPVGRLHQSSRKNRPMLGFRAAAVGPGTFFQGLHHFVVHILYQEICHPMTTIDINAIN